MIGGEKKIIFVLPSSGVQPAGGFKIVYDYANRMAEDGWNVYIAHCVKPSCGSFQQRILTYAKYLLRLLLLKPGPRAWYNLSSKIKMVWLPCLKQEYFLKYDSIVLTSWETAYILGDLGIKYNKNVTYFIQGYESWSISIDKLHRTYKMNLKNIVVSKELKEILQGLSVHSEIVPNFAEDSFYIEIPFNERRRLSFLFNWHDKEFKGSKEILEALRQLKEEFPEISVEAFGTKEGPKEDWIKYSVSPARDELRRIYNQNKVFISASRSEGWGLMPFEAMQCGCVPIVSNIGGHKEYINDRRNGLLFDPNEPNSLRDTLKSVIKNERLLFELHEEVKSIKEKFRFESSYEKFIKVIREE